ncbi:BglG family transcription antiterminator [Holdemania filiformis]|uniref:BglG family transcription antiterminator n=1 Tax=Holdemania filiformis TaxID=61171 RepID=UPI002430131D|nr:BglG family transcription antiterminator [Holdemania filiformis]
MTTIYEKIIRIIQENAGITCSQIAEKVSLSTKTVYSKIKDLNAQLEGAKIVAKMGKGFYLDIFDEDKFQKCRSDYVSKTSPVPTGSKERISFIVKSLLLHDGYIKIETIADRLYTSRNTISTDLKEVESRLNNFDIKIKRKPGYGLTIEGTELNIRRCLISTIFRYKTDSLRLDIDNEIKRRIVEDVTRTLKRHNTNIAEYNFDNVIIHAYVAYLRNRYATPLDFGEKDIEQLKAIIGADYFEIAQDLVKTLEKSLSISFGDGEISYLAMHLGGKATINSDNLIINKRIEKLVMNILEYINDDLHLDFRNDLDLYLSLIQHIVPLDIRMRYSITARYPLTEHIISKYPLAYTIATSAASYLRSYYGNPLPEDETALLAVIFGLATDKRSKNKYNIAVICASGKGTAALFMRRFQEAFKPYIGEIYELNAIEVIGFDFKSHHIDYAFSTIDLRIPVPVPLIEVSIILDEQDIHHVHKVLDTGSNAFIRDYFKAEYFIPDLKAENKTEALTKIVDQLKTCKKVRNDYLASILQREELGQTEFGNQVALPHAMTPDDQTYVFTAILNKPLLWDENEVQVIFLISLSDNDRENNENIYRVITNYFSNKALIENTLKERTYSNMIEQLKIANSL